MILRIGELSVAGGMWSTIQRTSRQTVDHSRFVDRPPGKLGWQHGGHDVVLHAGTKMEEDAVWSVFLPRAGAGETKVRAARLEHSLRV